MYWSKSFIPTSKENPSGTKIPSHQLLIRAGMIKQESAGIYSWLPMGFKVLKKIEEIVREEQKAAGAIEVLMPTLQSSELWIESGRYDGYGEEMLRISDRHDANLIYGPTNEEQITEIFRTYVKSYKNLPLNIYAGTNDANTNDKPFWKVRTQSGLDVELLNQTFPGSDKAEIVFAEAGNDTVKAGAGNDEVSGGSGDDELHGDAGNDKLDGGDGNENKKKDRKGKKDKKDKKNGKDGKDGEDKPENFQNMELFCSKKEHELEKLLSDVQENLEKELVEIKKLFEDSMYCLHICLL